MKIYNTSQNNIISEDTKVADNFVTRSIGLLSTASISDKQGLIIKPCCSIHTFFMRFNIDVIFVTKKNEVIAIYENVKPNKILPIHLNSYYVIELKAGVVKEKNINKNDILSLTK